MVDGVVRFVELDDYLRFAERVEMATEMAANKTLYDIWLDWDDASRNRVIVRLASARGVGVAGARAILDTGRPVVAGVTALGVLDLVEEYRRRAGVGSGLGPVGGRAEVEGSGGRESEGS